MAETGKTKVNDAQETVEDFRNRIKETVEASFLAVAIHVGHKLRLFDVLHDLASRESPKTSQEIADAAKFKERYVREWLRSMVAGNIVECDESVTRFWLPGHRFKSLTADGPTPCVLFNHLMGMTHEIDALFDCFKLGGPRGIPYSRFASFLADMAETSRHDYEASLIPKFVPSIPRFPEGLETGIRVLDLGCGAGVALNLLAAQFPNSQFIGIDISEEAIGMAKASAEKISNSHFEIMDATRLNDEWTNSFDYVLSFDSIHDQGYPDRCLKEVYRILKPGGLFCMTDVEGTSNALLDREVLYKSFKYTASLTHCMPVSLYLDGGLGLGAMWGEKVAREMLAEAGFLDVQIKPAHSPMNVIYIAEKQENAKI